MNTHCIHGHELNAETAYIYPNGRYQCRVCRRATRKAEKRPPRRFRPINPALAADPYHPRQVREWPALASDSFAEHRYRCEHPKTVKPWGSRYCERCYFEDQRRA